MGDKQKHLACLLTVKAVPDPQVNAVIIVIVIVILNILGPKARSSSHA